MHNVTTCSFDCPDQCSIRCRVSADGVRLRGNPEHPFTRGFTCAKIRTYLRRLTSPHRIREPWLRRGDQFHPIPWDEALERAAAAVTEALDHAPASLLLVRGDGCKGLSKSFADYLFGSLGARSTRGSLCDSAGIAAIEADAGALDMNDPMDLDHAERIVLWGKQPRAGSVHTAAQLVRARRRGIPVLAVTPDATPLRNLADTVIRPRPGCDRFLALACAKRLLAGGSISPVWRSRAANPVAFTALLDTLDVDACLDQCGVGPGDLEILTQCYAAGPHTATLVGWGLQRSLFGAETVRAIHAVAFLAGALGVSGGGLYFNVSSSRHFSKPSPDRPPAPPLSLPCIAEDLAHAQPAIRCAWFTCSNLLNQGPDAKACAEAFSAVPDRIVVDGFWTETARHATLLLPSTLWPEEEDVVGSYWRNTLGAVRRIVDPVADCRSDFDILSELGTRIGWDNPFPDRDAWLAACLPGGSTMLADLRERGWCELKWNPVAWSTGFAHADGRFRFLETLTPQRRSDPEHPLTLLTHIRRDSIHSQREPEHQHPPLPIRVHPDTAAGCGLESGSPARLVSSVGEIEGEIHVDPGLHPEVVACPRGGWLSRGLGVNQVTEALTSDRGECAAFYSTRVRLEPKSGHPPR